MHVKFFQEDGRLDPDAIEAGVYQFRIGLTGCGRSAALPLYIGESYSMAVRCSSHLYEVFHNDPAYFGLSKEHLEDDRLELRVEVYETVQIQEGTPYSDRDIQLRERERAAIKKEAPLAQNPGSDNLRRDRVKVVNDAILRLLRSDGK